MKTYFLIGIFRVTRYGYFCDEKQVPDRFPEFFQTAGTILATKQVFWVGFGCSGRGFVVGFRTEHFRFDPSDFQPGQAKIRKMSLQGNAPNLFNFQSPDDSLQILVGTHQLPNPCNFRANRRLLHQILKSPGI